MRFILALAIVGLALAAGFVAFGDPLLANAGTRPVIRHGVPEQGVWIALGIAAVALVWLVSGIHGHIAAGLVAVMALLMAAHDIAEDPVAGTVSERIALLPVRTLSVPPDVTPTWRVSLLAVQIETGAGTFTTIRGVPPVAIEFTTLADADGASPATFSDR